MLASWRSIIYTVVKRFLGMVAPLALLLVMASSAAAERTGPVVVPENGYATGASYGSGWKCSFGFREVRDACVEVVVPANGFLDEAGSRWQCTRGYRQAREECLAIPVPENGYLTESSSTGWQCERGYRAKRNRCELIPVPENAYLTDSSYGEPWKCERGYRQRQKSCVKVVVPENAYLEDRSYGPGWECDRGYVSKDGQRCDKIDLPEQAHLNRKGDAWRCNPPYVKRANACVLR